MRNINLALKLKKILVNIFSLLIKISLPNEKFILVISHSDYLVSIGGTEKYIFEQANDYINNNYKVVSVFPAFRNGFWDDKESNYGVRINENLMGYFKLIDIINALCNKKQYIHKIELHHFMYWTKKDIVKLKLFIASIEVNYIVYVHDFFMFSPSIYHLYLGKIYDTSKIYNVDKNYNFIEKFTDEKTRLEWKNFYEGILIYANKIIVPSTFIKMSVSKYFKDISSKIIVKEHLKMIPTKREKRILNKKIKIAYLGYSAEFKGWKTWERIIADEYISNTYDLYHIGGTDLSDKHIKNIPYSFKDDGINAAVMKLVENSIDVVLLWSIIPESYSYTLFEAMAASSFILTNTLSGNIHYKIKEIGQQCGRIFKDEYCLIEYLRNIDAVKVDVERNINDGYILEFNRENIIRGENK